MIDLDAAGFTFASADGEFLVLLFEFRNDVASYFATRVGVPVAGGTLQAAIDFNNAHADVEMPFFNQDIFDLADLAGARAPTIRSRSSAGMTYNQALAIDQTPASTASTPPCRSSISTRWSSATDNPAWSTDLLYGDHFIFGTSGLAAAPGYPILQVPAGMVLGVPLGISFFGTAFSEPTLIRLASGYEAVTHVRADNLPTFAPTIPSDHIAGTTLVPVRRAAVPAAVRRSDGVRRPHHL